MSVHSFVGVGAFLLLLLHFIFIFFLFLLKRKKATTTWALSICSDLGFSHLIVEWADQELTRLLQHEEDYLSKLGLLAEDIKELGSLFRSIIFNFADKHCSLVASALAKAAHAREGLFLWFEGNPSFIHSIVQTSIFILMTYSSV